VASISTLSNSLRSEISDIGKTFVDTFIGDGATKIFQLNYYPVNGTGLVVKVGNTDVSSTSTIEEHTGKLTLASAPAANAIVSVGGTYYRYFTDAEIQNYINIAFAQHANTEVNPYGTKTTIANLPTVEEYPVVVLASTLALFTLATDSAYDIDIQAPDGVNIPRSERYRQLMDIIATRKEQYRELCTLLNIGLHRIEVATLRRISPRTNRYVPVYKPQELDDSSFPQRLHVPIPTYMDQTVSNVISYDILMYQEDSYVFTVDFPYSLTGYNLLAQIRAYAGADLVLATFNIDVIDAANGKATLSLTSDQTRSLPQRSIWDLQVTSTTDPTWQHTYIKGTVIVERQVTTTNREPYASGWMG